MNLKTAPVEEWFEGLVRRNDFQAFEKLFHHFYKPLFRYALKYVGSPMVAEEVVSDVFFKIWKNRERITIQDSLQAYLFKSVRNQSLDYLKSQAHLRNNHEEIPLHLENGYANPEEEIIAEELNQQIENAIETLPPQCRVIFRLSRDNGLKYKEIAEKMNLSVKTVETQMGRALKQLRVILKESIATGFGLAWLWLLP